MFLRGWLHVMGRGEGEGECERDSIHTNSCTQQSHTSVHHRSDTQHVTSCVTHTQTYGHTYGFQCSLDILYSELNMIGMTTSELCSINPTTYSLFQRYSALSATWGEQWVQWGQTDGVTRDRHSQLQSKHTTCMHSLQSVLSVLRYSSLLHCPSLSHCPSLFSTHYTTHCTMRENTPESVNLTHTLQFVGRVVFVSWQTDPSQWCPVSPQPHQGT